MPDQPADPLHYDMKIPPETHQAKHEHTGEAQPHSDEIADGDQVGDPAKDLNTQNAKDTNVVRGDDRPQAVRNDG